MQIIEFPPYSVIRNDKAKVSVSNNNILIFKENYLWDTELGNKPDSIAPHFGILQNAVLFAEIVQCAYESLLHMILITFFSKSALISLWMWDTVVESPSITMVPISNPACKMNYYTL